MSAVASGGAALQLPLFPLNTVLFSGGRLALRIFETRYVDMVRRCMREQTGFGVILIREGREAGEVSRTADVGTLANIIDFNQLPDGLLGITAAGGAQFQVLRRWRAQDGLNLAAVEWLSEMPAKTPRPDQQEIVQWLRNILPRLQQIQGPLQPEFDNAGWIGARIAEVLPISTGAQQALLEMRDPLLRLDALAPLLKDLSG